MTETVTDSAPDFIWDVLEDLTASETPEAATDGIASSPGMLWTDVSPFGLYLADHLERLPSISSDEDWLDFVLEGTSSAKREVAASCERVLAVLNGQMDIEHFLPRHHAVRGGPGKSASIVQLSCPNERAYGSTVSKWARAAWLIKSKMRSESTRLFLLSLHSSRTALNLFVWVNQLNQSEAHLAPSLGDWTQWTPGCQHCRTIIHIPGNHRISYDCDGPAVFPVVNPGTVVSMLLLGGDCTRSGPADPIVSGRIRTPAVMEQTERLLKQALNWSRGPGTFEDGASELGHWTIRPSDEMPFFSTLNLFLGRRKRKAASGSGRSDD